MLYYINGFIFVCFKYHLFPRKKNISFVVVLQVNDEPWITWSCCWHLPKAAAAGKVGCCWAGDMGKVLCLAVLGSDYLLDSTPELWWW
jgi:hypothetical protein